MTSEERESAEVIAFDSAKGFEDWLEAHVDHQGGVWLKIAKAGTGIPTLTSDEAVDVGLCFGWISGQRKSLDGEYYLQKYVPRRPRSRWSQVNVRKVEQLLTAGRMRPAGIAEVEAAKADGRWAAAYVSQKEAEVPEDLAAALGQDPAVAARFEALNRTERYAIILDLSTARTSSTRQNRLGRALDRLRGTDPAR